MENEEWGMENGEWRMENGEWRKENVEWREENGDWREENGEGRMENGEWGIFSDVLSMMRNRYFQHRLPISTLSYKNYQRQNYVTE